MDYFIKTLASPVGQLGLVASERGLAAVLWERERPGRVVLPAALEVGQHPLLDETVRQLQAYFKGRLKRFALPLDPHGTEFQRTTWQALSAIPFGTTRTYAQIASDIGRPAAARAVGAANGRNPISIVVPCHRVIGADGSLTGFAGGLEAKAYLLRHESR